MRELTTKDQQIIQRNLTAFRCNFGDIKIARSLFGNEYFIYRNEDDDINNYIYCCDNIDNLNGWLYGAVQVANKIIKPLEDRQ